MNKYMTAINNICPQCGFEFVRYQYIDEIGKEDFCSDYCGDLYYSKEESTKRALKRKSELRLKKLDNIINN